MSALDILSQLDDSHIAQISQQIAQSDQSRVQDLAKNATNVLECRTLPTAGEPVKQPTQTGQCLETLPANPSD